MCVIVMIMFVIVFIAIISTALGCPPTGGRWHSTSAFDSKFRKRRAKKLCSALRTSTLCIETTFGSNSEFLCLYVYSCSGTARGCRPTGRRRDIWPVEDYLEPWKPMNMCVYTYIYVYIYIYIYYDHDNNDNIHTYNNINDHLIHHTSSFLVWTSAVPQVAVPSLGKSGAAGGNSKPSRPHCTYHMNTR